MSVTRHVGVLLTILALPFVLLSCGSGDDTDSGSAASVLLGPDSFAAAVEDPERVVINVHVPFEGDIEGTDLSISFDQIEARAAELPRDRSTPLAIYCQSGRMSAEAAVELQELGYTDVVDLRGGMAGWVASGRELDTSPAG